MHPPLLTKFVYQIRSRNGALVDNLQISGRTEEEARAKLEQMYRYCEILSIRMLTPDRVSSASYEDVLSMIANDQQQDN
jgi:hypothetical protein